MGFVLLSIMLLLLSTDLIKWPAFEWEDLNPVLISKRFFTLPLPANQPLPPSFILVCDKFEPGGRI